MRADVIAIDGQFDRRHVRVASVEGDVLQQLLEDRVQAAGADVLRSLVGSEGGLGDGLNGAVLEGQQHVVHGQQGLVLQRKRVVRLSQDALEVLTGQGLQVHMHRETALQLGDQVADLGHMEGAGSDEEHIVRLHGAVFGVDGAALNDGQDVALHAFPADVRAAAGTVSGNLVDLVDEHDAVLLGALDGLLVLRFLLVLLLIL